MQLDTQQPDTQQPDAGGAVVPLSWVTIQKGTFTMGSPAGEKCRQPAGWSGKETQHKVTLTHDFEMQATEMMMSQVQPSAASWYGTRPAEATWHQAAQYCNYLSLKAGIASCYDCSYTGVGFSAALCASPYIGTLCGGGKLICKVAQAYSRNKIYACPGYRLPTEAEWEYAYRAGTTSPYYSGDAEGGEKCSICSVKEANADKIGWYCANAASKQTYIATHPAMQKQANAWGLYDMAGNLAEWCHDQYQDDLGASSATDPWGASSSTLRVVRGGSVYTGAANLRAAFRAAQHPTTAIGTGFRCVRTK